jgi:hypothetical protein
MESATRALVGARQARVLLRSLAPTSNADLCLGETHRSNFGHRSFVRDTMNGDPVGVRPTTAAPCAIATSN